MLDEEKLKFFTSKISIWDHFSMHESSYKSLSTEEKTALLKRYYIELGSKYYGKESGNLCSLPEDVSKDFKANFYEKNMLLEKNIEMIIIASRFEDKKGQLSTSIQIWSQYGYFNQQPSDFNIKKDFKENSSIYIK